jgi:3',5'-cyclic-AMP phosphodiesterase
MIARLAWVTDIHLDFLGDQAVEKFAGEIAATKADAVLVGGDISTAPALVRHLVMLEAHLLRPIYFVLGNHDAYHGSIAEVQAFARDMTKHSRHLRWLPEVGAVPLGDRACLLGCDGWGDARYGDYDTSTVMLNDFVLIRELAGLGKDELKEKLHALGDSWGAWVARHLPPALEKYEEVLFLTHVPPFREACWHEGRISDDEWLPHFTSKGVGDAIVGAAERRPDRRIRVLCGHTHGRGEVDIRPNVHVSTGEAHYGAPHVQRVVEVG